MEMNEESILSMIQKDEWMMEILKTVKSFNLPDWWICAGFVRSKIWDSLHNYEQRTPIPDIDVIYFDPEIVSEQKEKQYENQLKNLMCSVPWSVKNEARMHLKSHMLPYTSSIDAISKFPETATALGVKLDDKENIVLAAPYGIQDVIHLEVKPTPYFKEDMERIKIYEDRVTRKNWNLQWNKLNIHHINMH